MQKVATLANNHRCQLYQTGRRIADVVVLVDIGVGGEQPVAY